MSRQINQPINQVRLTNVAVVRMNKGGKRFEIACYRNKVMDYRQGLEQDLSEVLQTERVFTNVSKGEFAKAKDLQKVFGTKNEEEVSILILTKGQLQVSDKERSQQIEKTTAQIAEWISKNCVHPSSERPYTISQTRHAMQQANFSVHPTKPLKRQYLDCVKLLQRVIPIQRAKMELLLLVPDVCRQKVEDALQEKKVTWSPPPENVEEGQQKYQILVDPSLYRVLNEVIHEIDGARIEIINQVVTKQGDVNLEAEVRSGNTTGENYEELISEQSEGLQQMHISDKFQASESEDEIDTTTSRRKQQKKARKKNQKSKRRELEHNAISAATEIPVTLRQPIQSTVPLTPGDTAGGSSDSRKSCNTCGGFFDSAAAYRSHFKSDWHKYNQKLKMKGIAPVSEKEFIMCDNDTFFGGNM